MCALWTNRWCFFDTKGKAKHPNDIDKGIDEATNNVLKTSCTNNLLRFVMFAINLVQLSFACAKDVINTIISHV